MKQDSVIKILFVADALEHAEQIISQLRNGGIAVRPARVGNEAEFLAALDSLGPDLVLAVPGARDLPLADVARLIGASARDIALLALLDSIDAAALAQAFRGGARAVALAGNTEQLRGIVLQEADALIARRAVRRLEAALRESDRRCDALLDSSRDPIAYVHEGMHVRANQAYLEMLGFEEFAEIEGQTLLDLVAEDGTEDFRGLLKRLSRGEPPPARLDLRLKRADGSVFDALLEFSQASFEGEPCLQIIVRRQVVDESLLEQLQRDAVTGLYNRTHFIDLLGNAVTDAGKGRNDQAVLLLEPDHFASVVDRIGISNVDTLLRGSVERIKGVLGPNDIAARFSDHGFVILLRGRPHESVQVLCTALLQAINGAILDLGNHSLAVTVSIGGSLMGEKNANTAAVLDQAGNMLRNAQGEGGNRFALYDPAAQERADAEKDKRWHNLLRDALAHGRFVMFHQQVIALLGSEGNLSELLLRMDGAQGLVLPGIFMPVAARHGLLPAIDRWVLREAIRLLGSSGFSQQSFFIKISTPSLLDEKLADWIGEKLRESSVDGQRLILEFQENEVVTNLRHARRFGQQTRALGCRLALERFGVGLNSFQLLDHVDADFLKLDRSFVNDLARNAENQRRVREIAQQAQARGKETVAEWVEDVNSVSLLFAAGISYVQGNFQHEPERLAG